MESGRQYNEDRIEKLNGEAGRQNMKFEWKMESWRQGDKN